MQAAVTVPDLSKLTHTHLTQIKMELWNNRGGGPEGKIINSFYSGATPDQLMSRRDVLGYADDLIHILGDSKAASDFIDKAIDIRMHVPKHIVDNLIKPYAESKKSTMEVYNEISLDWKTQIYNHVVRKFGGKQSSYLQDVTKDTALPQLAVEKFADVVIGEYDNDPRLAADALKSSITEHVTLMTASAMNQAMKEKGLMGALTKVTDKMIENSNEKEKDLVELSELMEASQSTENPTEFVKPVVKPVKRKLKKKGAKRQTHLDNIKGHGIKQAMGANILRKLGAIQQKTLDHTKHQLLQELPMADLVEVASGEKLPDYQANLLNMMQAKADPNAPIVNKVKSGTIPYIKQHVDIVNKMLGKEPTKPYAVALDEALDAYISEDLLPEGVDAVNLAQVKEAIREYPLEKHKTEILSELQSETAKVLELTEQFEDSIPLVRMEVSDEYGESFFIRRKDNTELRFTVDAVFEDVADEIETTIAFVEDRAKGPEYLKGLNRTVAEHLVDMDLSSLEGDENAVYYVYRRFLVGYTAGFVKGMADAAVKNAPVVKRQTETKAEVITQLQEECVAVQQDVEKLEDQLTASTFDELMQEALNTYITPDFYPEGVDQELLEKVVANVRQYFLEQHEELTLQNMVERLFNELDDAGIVSPTMGTKVRSKLDEWGNKSYHLTIDEYDPDPSSTIAVVFEEYAKTQNVVVTKGELTVAPIGGSVKDIHLTYIDQRAILHYERFTELAADQLQSTLEFITSHITDKTYYIGLLQSIIEHGEPKFAEWVDTFDFEQAVGLIEKIVVGYTVGYVQGIVYSLHKQTPLTQTAPAADLGI